MNIIKRLALTACAASALLAFAVGTAPANRALGIRPGGPIFAEGPVRLNESLGVANIECELHLEGVLRGVVQKVPSLPIGEAGMLTRDEFRECETLRRPVVVEGLVEPGTPAPIVYNSFLGVLPAITGVLMIALNVGVQVTIGESRCLYRGNVPFLLWKSPGEGLFNRKTFLANRLAYVRGNCMPASWLELEGTMIMRPGQMITLM